MDFKKTNIIISEKQRPLWQVVLSALFFTITFAQLGYMLWKFYYEGVAFGLAIESMDRMIFTFLAGLRFSVVFSIHFDIVKKRYKKQYAVGHAKYGKWESLPNIEYISVFKQGLTNEDGDDKGHAYDVNVWHDTSKHFTIYTNNEVEPAFEMAKYMALKLDVDFLDATVPNNYQWVELYKDMAE